MLKADPKEHGSAQRDDAGIGEASQVTAKATSTAAPGRATPAEFMSAVVAWPKTPTDPGYVNLHYSMPARSAGGKLPKGSMGWPYKDLDSFIERARWINSVPDKFKDVWFCTSSQSKARKNKRGNPKAVSKAANAVQQKSTCIELKIKPNDSRHYGDEKEALKAILSFQIKVDLPRPSAIVRSGDGLDVYWISKDRLLPHEWDRYAKGLKALLLANGIKCDTGLTTDIAGILRVPGTFNHEYDPPKPVTLAPLPLVTYDFPSKLGFLRQFAGPIVAPAAKGPTLRAKGLTTQGNSEPDGNASIDKFGDQPLDPFPIFTQRGGLLIETLVTLWVYSLLRSSLGEEGNDIGQRVSEKGQRLPRCKRGRSMIANRLTLLIEELETQAASQLRARSARRAGRARSSQKGSRCSACCPEA
jgi:hypothetical protein